MVLRRRLLSSALGRFLVAALCGVVAAALAPVGQDWQLRGIAGWDAFAFVLLLFAANKILRTDPGLSAAEAAADDPGRNAVWVLAVLSSFFSLFAAVVALAHVQSTRAPGIWSVLALAAVVLSWLITHAAYTLRYARLYYGEPPLGEGLAFPGKAKPNDLDFAYFSFTIGMCFQTSDVAVESAAIRHTVLGHAVVSFVFNTTILALTLNLVLRFLPS